MEFSPVHTTLNLISEYSKLFSLCFSNARHLTDTNEARKYLQWLYRDNPEGKVVGYDAWEGDTLAAHYSTIPVNWSFSGNCYKGLLSLNTATHPEFRGKGLFTQLAEKTYQAAQSQGYDFVIGVANHNSTPGFLRKLGFSLVTPLQARIGLGALPTRTREYLQTSPSLTRHNWNETSLSWRLSNPNNPGCITGSNSQLAQIEAPTDKPFFNAYAEIPHQGNTIDFPKSGFGFRLMLGTLPENLSWGGYLPVPDKLKPSPLNLIYLPLQGDNLQLNNQQLYFNFLDFDAY
ncbi:GNAT family N-acetyltransferase [Kiloniella laminariae]|uniref:GNAT family N-acetyltransferase n=1 Tax=Kiloniella laminariae TaxID=454162 RepID=A0ABT4LIH4_9PROT|nr:GNAT family N-acetyltransferase [Kiloniella laminariae]MCZ4280908.1 GNAT family N-acetyltransferase [Kiloniella laminariae]